MLPILPMPEKIHNFRLPLKSIWQEDKDFPLDDINLFVERLNHKAIYLPNVKANLPVIVRASMLEATAREVLVEEEVFFHLNHKPMGQLYIGDIVSQSRLEEKAGLVDRKYIPVVPLPKNLPKMCEKSHFAKLCSEEQLGRMYTQYLFSVDRKRSDTERHPPWTQLKMNIPFQTTKLSVISTTANTAAKQLATMG